MSNNFSSFVDDVKEGGLDEYAIIGSESQIRNTNKMPSIYYKDTIQGLKSTIEVQNTFIDELSSKINEIKVDFKVQNKLTALEITFLKEKSEFFQHKVEVLEANQPMNDKLKFDHFQCTLDILQKENEFMKSTILKLLNKINFIESQLGNRSSFGNKNESYQMNSKLINSMADENDNICWGEEFDDSHMVTSAVLNEEPAITTAFVNSVVHRTNKNQQTPTISEPTKTIEDNTDYVLTTKTALNHLESDLHCLNVLKDDENCTSTKGNRDQVIHELTGHSFQVQEQIGTVKNTVNDFEYVSNPVCALNELCMARNWLLPKYEFFKDNDSKTFTYSVELTVLTYIVRVEGLMKKEAKKEAATIMYNKLKNVTRVNVPSEKNYGQKIDELISHSKSKIVHEQEHIGIAKSTMKNLNNSENAIDTKKLELDPISALNELCMSRNWTWPKYEFFNEVDCKTITYSVECTLMTNTVRVKGLLKKEVKRHAATIMYNKLKNVNRNNVPLGKKVGNEILENTFKDNGTLDKTYTGLTEKQAIAAVFGASVFNLNDDERAAKVCDLEMSKKVVDHPTSMAKHDTNPMFDTTKFPKCNENYVSPLNESVNSPDHADLANRLRLSNNPSVCKLKELNSINKITVPSCIELVNRIVEEEGLTIEYEICTNSTIVGKKCMAMHIAMRSGTLTVVGYGKTIIDCEVDAYCQCLIRFKSMLKK